VWAPLRRRHAARLRLHCRAACQSTTIVYNGLYLSSKGKRDGVASMDSQDFLMGAYLTPPAHSAPLKASIHWPSTLQQQPLMLLRPLRTKHCTVVKQICFLKTETPINDLPDS